MPTRTSPVAVWTPGYPQVTICCSVLGRGGVQVFRQHAGLPRMPNHKRNPHNAHRVTVSLAVAGVTGIPSLPLGEGSPPPLIRPSLA